MSRPSFEPAEPERLYPVRVRCSVEFQVEGKPVPVRHDFKVTKSVSPRLEGLPGLRSVVAELAGTMLRDQLLAGDWLRPPRNATLGGRKRGST